MASTVSSRDPSCSPPARQGLCTAAALAWRLAAQTSGQAAGQTAATAAAAPGTLAACTTNGGIAGRAAAQLLGTGSRSLSHCSLAFSNLGASAVASQAAAPSRLVLLPIAPAPLRRSGLAAALAQRLHTAGWRCSASAGSATNGSPADSSGSDAPADSSGSDASGDGGSTSGGAQRASSEGQESSEDELQQMISGLKQAGYRPQPEVQEMEHWVDGRSVKKEVKAMIRWTKPVFKESFVAWFGALSIIFLVLQVSPSL